MKLVHKVVLSFKERFDNSGVVFLNGLLQDYPGSSLIKPVIDTPYLHFIFQLGKHARSFTEEANKLNYSAQYIPHLLDSDEFQSGRIYHERPE